MTALLEHLEGELRKGKKLLVPYLLAGIPDRAGFPDALTAGQRHADAMEVGLPYSDPLMDGPVIAAAAERAIRAGIGPLDGLELARSVRGSCPRIAMTYYNPIHRTGEADFCRRAADADFEGLIVPDLPLEESSALRRAAAAAGLAWVPLVAPTSSRERVRAIAGTATGFVYAASTLGVTGTREALSERATRLATTCKEVTDLPVLVGIGVSTPEQARAATRVADGVVMGSAVVSRALESGAAAVESFLGEVREALDQALPPGAGRAPGNPRGYPDVKQE